MKKVNVISKCLLFPFAFLYRIVTGVRNMFFEWKILPSERFQIPILCIGNIAVGGTGKTPFTEYLIRLLKGQYRVATLSRGYKRKTSGFVLAQNDCTAYDVGDEACQIKHKFPDVIVAVDANRRRGIRKLLALSDGERPDVILLDDGMQHRYVKPSFTIMLTDFNNIYFEDRMLPVGTLRESAKGVYRSDIVIVTKCQKQLKPIDLRLIEKHMALMANQRLYFSNITYQRIEALFPSLAQYPCNLSELNPEEDIILITGVANPQSLIDTVQSYSNRVSVCMFKDHHVFKQSDIRRIEKILQTKSTTARRIICTEKDAMRLRSLKILPESWKSYLYYIPITMEFLFNRGENFDARILKHITSINILRERNVKD